MVSRRPLTSSVMRRKRPLGFSFKEKTKVFRSIWIFSVFRVSSLLLGFGLEGVSTDAERNAVMGRALDHLLD